MQIRTISPCLWFDGQAEDAAEFYTEVFPDSRITHVARYPHAGREIHGRPPGSVMTVSFELNGRPFTALNGGPLSTFNESISFQVHCDTQSEIDYFWEKLSAGGDPAAQQCGWLKDRFGLSWQIVPAVLSELVAGPDPRRAERVMTAMLRMKKLDAATLQRAAAGRFGPATVSTDWTARSRIGAQPR